ncbi:MAG: NAD-dependent malic enzyme [Pseudomonadota bacterium]
MGSQHTITTKKRGVQVIQDPLLNKGTAFNQTERDQLQLNGLLPAHISTHEEQLQRAYQTVTAHAEPLDRYVALLALQDRNEHLFYSLLMTYMGEFMPIVYTPTVGLACQHFSHVFQRARGLWITPDMRGRIEAVLRAATHGRDIELIVATDNESILGIGDQGAGGMAISVGKLALYVAGAGINPEKTLPISIDVGTNNQTLLDDDLYLGFKAARLTGEEYQSFVDEFVTAVVNVCPNALLQWEDFRKDNALSILNRHRNGVLSFNDDIQGTGAVALAGLFSALRITQSEMNEHRILIHGAGAAGMGIANQIRATLQGLGQTADEARHQMAVLDSRGLLVNDQPIADEYKKALAWDADRAREAGFADLANRTLEQVVNTFKPTILIGTSGQAGAFTQSITATMSGYCERPIILPFSNPTSLSEATPADLLRWSDGKALVATGSPFKPVEYEGKTHVIGQGNNVFIFPGLGLGALLAKSTEVTDNMVTAAAAACAESVTQDELDQGMLYPAIERLRDVSANVAKAVALQASAEGLSNIDESSINTSIDQVMWQPDYPELLAE